MTTIKSRASRRPRAGHIQVRVYWEGPVSRVMSVLADLANALMKQAAEAETISLRPADPSERTRPSFGGLEDAFIAWVDPQPGLGLCSGDVVIEMCPPQGMDLETLKLNLMRATRPVVARHSNILSLHIKE